MTETIPLSMALYDYLPNFIFLAGAWRLYQRRYHTPLFLGGLGLVFLNGLTKATWKLIIALGGPDVVWLSQIFVVLLATGFILMAIATLQVYRASGAAKSPLTHPAGPLLAMALWKIPFMLLATVGAVGAFVLWILEAVRRKSWLAGLAFTLGLVATLAMSGISGGSMDLAAHWMAQSVNVFGQTCFAIGAFTLTKPSQATFTQP